MNQEKNNNEIKDELGNSSKPLLQAVSLLPQLDRWIESCEKQAEIFRENKLITSEISSNAMAQAYWNVKQLIEVNCL
jgi:hypothetical protein